MIIFWLYFKSFLLTVELQDGLTKFGSCYIGFLLFCLLVWIFISTVIILCAGVVCNNKTKWDESNMWD